MFAVLWELQISSGLRCFLKQGKKTMPLDHSFHCGAAREGLEPTAD
jgi:hypothetical protein